MGGPMAQLGAMSINDFCKWAGIGRSLAYEEIKAGRLETRKVGRRTIVTWVAAEAWLNALPVNSGTTQLCE